MFLIPAVRSAPVVSFPTDAHYRPGRYMPVQIHGITRGDSIELLAKGSVPTQVDHPQPGDLIVPWLIADEFINDARWQLADGAAHPLALHPLSDAQRLVAFAGAPPDVAGLLFPGNSIVPVQLDESRPLLEPVEAWECLDAVVLSASAAARVDEAHRAALLAAGTIIAVRSANRPDDHWPWELRGGYWILQYAPAGPQAIIEPDVYTPTFGWDRGWPASFRHRVVFAVLIFCILALATLLWRSRWAVVAFTLTSLLFIAGLAIWYSRQSPVLQLSAAMRIEAGPLTQFDLWTWQSPVRSTDASFRFVGLTHPFLASIRQIEQTQLQLVCRPDGGADRFQFHIGQGQSLAFCSRQIGLAGPSPELARASPMWARFAEGLYLRAGERVLGQYQPQGADIPVIVIGGRKS